MEVALLAPHGNFVLTSCFTPWHMPRCPALNGLLDKAKSINVIDNVIDAIYWESTVTNLFAHIDAMEKDHVWGDMEADVHERFRREFGRVLELAVQFLYAPVNYQLRSHKGLQYRRAMREFMDMQ